MNREQLSDAIGRLDESIVSEAMVSHRRRKPWWYAAVAVAACVCLAVGMVTVWPTLKPQGVTPSVDGVIHSTNGGMNTIPTTRPHHEQPDLAISFALAKAQYPQMAQRVGYFEDEQGYYTWREAVAVQRAKADGHTGGMTDYYAKTMAQFLAGEVGENRVYSPLNVYMALAMLAETAEGDSRQQILDLLGVSDLSALREKCSGLWNGVYLNDGAVTSLLANSLWLSDDDYWQYDMDKVNTLAEHYYASTFEGEMGSEAYNQALQDWINEQTDNLLTEQAGGLEFDPNTVLALASTICFKMRWYDEFVTDCNTEGVFKTANGDVPVTYMNQNGMGCGYFGEQFTAVSLGLDDGAYAMYFFLPDEGVSVNDLLTDKQMLKVLQEGTDSELFHHLMVEMSIPKFDVVSDKNLVDGLQALGVTDVFDATKGNFGGILTKQTDPMWVSKVQHAARVAIDEEGVTAAAYTVEMMDGMGSIQETLEFVVDRPFMFAITGPENTILFTGVVENP
ncbi:MAG: serpin family protein [Clostridia bacterium]|nr:serpin family protein [Clostridia bacterium]